MDPVTTLLLLTLTACCCTVFPLAAGATWWLLRRRSHHRRTLEYDGWAADHGETPDGDTEPDLLQEVFECDTCADDGLGFSVSLR